MKSLLVLFCCFVNVSAYAGSLKCSSNGTDVYYINGILTSRKGNTDSSNFIKNAVDAKTTIIDSGPIRKNNIPAVRYTGIYNPSFGFVNDSAELFAQAYYIKTGNNSNAKAIYNTIKNMPESSSQDRHKYDPDGIFSHFVSDGPKRNINYISLIEIAKETESVALKNSLASTEDLVNENLAVVNSVVSKYNLSKSAKSKILFIAHSQGNAVLSAGIRKMIDTQPEQDEYMKKFMGVYQVASPVPVLDQTFKTRSVRTNEDTIIRVASAIPGYPLETAPVTHTVTSLNNPDFTGHLFLDTYLSPNVFVRKINTNETSVSARDNFVNTLADLATDLEDNCYEFDIVLSNPSNSTEEISSQVTGDFENGFHDKGIFPADGIVKFSMKLSSAFGPVWNGEKVELYRADTNTLLNSTEFSLKFTKGGNYTIPLKVIRTKDGVAIGDPILKDLKIHLSERAKVRVAMAHCWASGRPEEGGYFSLDGALFSWGVSTTGASPLKMNNAVLYTNSHNQNGGPDYYPDLRWFEETVANSKLRSRRIIISDSGGVVFDEIVNNPCEKDRSLPDTEILPVE